MSAGSTKSDAGPLRRIPRKATTQSTARVPEIEPTILFREIPAACELTPATRGKLRRFASRLNLDAAGGRGFDCVITNDAEMQSLNRTFLKHDYPTDVLSFPSDSKHGIIGELAVSVERAVAQADDFGHSLIEELQILVLHGVLHLLGHDHERDRDRMEKEEERLRAEYGLPNGLIGRATRRTSRTPNRGAR
jgi:probable rRNA maturation factor